MRRFNLAFTAGITAAMAFLTVPARASYIISLQQVGSNVVATGSGSIDTTNLTLPDNNSSVSQINPVEGHLYLGPISATSDTIYSGVTGPASFGTINTNALAASGSGPIVGLNETSHAIFVPLGYVSGTALATSTDTFSNKTFSGLGLTPGSTYTYSWGTGPDADTFSVQVTPEPACLSLFAAVGLTMLRRHPRSRGRGAGGRGAVAGQAPV